MRRMLGTVLAVLLLIAGFAAGFSQGERKGFSRGGEWAIVQAGILAREAGVFMPVYMEEGSFRVVIRQPRNLYKRAWKLADQQEAAQERTAPAVEQRNGAVPVSGEDPTPVVGGGRIASQVSTL